MAKKKLRSELQAILETPLMIEPRRMDQFLAPFVNADLEVELDPDAKVHATVEWGEAFRKEGATAVIPVVGPLLHRSNWLTEWLGIPTYDKLSRQLALAMDDDSVENVMLLIDSPGGQAAGVMDLADEIKAASSTKKVVAIAEDWATSAAYMLGSSAGEFYTTQTGITGSIGVVMAHVDASKQLDKMGLKITEIHAGAKKTVGSPFKELSDSDRAELQREVNSLYDVFTSKVAENRGISQKAVKATEAGIFTGAEGVDQNLVDGIHTSSGLLEELNAPAADPVLGTAAAASIVVGANDHLVTVNLNGVPPTREAAAEIVNQVQTQMETQATGTLTFPGQTVQHSEFLWDQTTIIFPVYTTDDTLGPFQFDLGPSTGGPIQPVINTPPEPAGQPPKEDEMSTPNDAGGVLSKAEADELRAELAKVEATNEAQASSLAQVEKREKDRVIDAHTTAGRIVPAMRATIDKLAEVMDAKELDTHLATFPVLTHVVPEGVVETDATGATADDREISRTLKIPLANVLRYGDVKTVRYDGTAEMQDGTIQRVEDLKKRA